MGTNLADIKIVQRCLSMHKEYPLDKRVAKCECGKGLEFALSGNFNFLESITKRDSMWRYERLMPIKSDNIVTAGEGNTPVYYLDDLRWEFIDGKLTEFGYFHQPGVEAYKILMKTELKDLGNLRKGLNHFG